MPTPIAMLAVKPAIEATWRAALLSAAEKAGQPLDLRLPGEARPGEVDYLILAPSGPVRDLAPFTGLRAVLNLWAGVEQALALPGLRADIPLARMVEPGLSEGMVEYVVGHVMRFHLDLDAVITGPPPPWFDGSPPLARDRRVGVLGLGALGAECAQALAALRFDVAGWSRTPKSVEGVACHAGPEGLDAVLSRSDILVLLLPHTPDTANLMNAARIARLPRGARLLNAGRGELIDESALLAALESGQIAHATLDVFREEPLPAAHPFHAHPRVTVTPHIASATRPRSASLEVVAQIGRMERGASLLHVVDRARGY